MTAVLRFIGIRIIGGLLRRHPLVRRLVLVGAVLRWFVRRYGNGSQQVTLRRGETLRVEIIPPGQAPT